MTTTGFGYTNEEEHSLIGPPAAADAQSQVGIAAPTPEEIEHEKQKLEAIQQELLQKKELGLYSEKDLLEESGKKILVDKGNSQVGIDSETGTPLVKHQSGAWLSSADAEYEKTLNEVATKAASHAGDQESEAQKRTQQAEQQHHEEQVQKIQTMAYIDAGSSNPHKLMDEAALQRVREGMSKMETQNLKTIIATVDGFAHTEATDLSPEMQHLKPTSVSGPGVDLAMEAVRKRKERENAEFAARMQRDKEKEKSKKS